MYDTYFGFIERPFAAVPQVDQYLPAAAIESARSAIARSVERGEGAAVVVGASGTGKTLLCQLLAEQFRGTMPAALLSSGRLSTRRALLQAILYELGQAYRGMDEGDLRLALVDYLTTGPGASQGMLLLVDEAHTLPLRLLDELRMLTNLSRDGQPLVRLVLAGASTLEERFASPKLDSFNQRLATRCYLQPLSRTETQEYIHARIEAVGGRGSRVFPAETCDAVYQATDGVPRLINQVCDHALLLACAGGRQAIEAAHIQEAWADLQQLPARSTGESSNEDAGHSTIEFGNSLDDLSPEINQRTVADGSTSAGAAASEVPMSSLHVTPSHDGDEVSMALPGEQIERIERMLAGVEEDFRPAGSIGPEVELIFDDPRHAFNEPYEEEEVVSDRYGRGREMHVQETPQPLPAPARGVALSGQRGAVLPEVEPETVRLSRPEDLAAAEADDADMMIVEDNYDDSPSPGVCPIIPVRRVEYGQLFARLRRG